jgi:hypothetical protein
MVRLRRNRGAPFPELQESQRRNQVYSGWVDDVLLVVSILKFVPLFVVPFTG